MEDVEETKTKGKKPKKEKPKKEKKSRLRWVTRDMRQHVSREETLAATLREMLIFLFFVTVVTMSSVGSHSSTMYFLTKAIQGRFVDTLFKTTDDMSISFSDIRTAADFWHYAETLLVNSLYWETYYEVDYPIAEASPDDQKILYENKLLGVPRIRQLRVREDSCTIHEYFRRLFLNCYDSFSTKALDTATFGFGNGTAWIYSNEDITKSITYMGQVATYEGGGYYQDLAPSRNMSLQIINELKNGLWITRNTRAIFVDFSIYNANVNLFCICKLIFEFPPTGGVLPSHSLNTVSLYSYVTTWDYTILISHILSMLLIFFYMLEEFREILYFKWKYLILFWTYMDFAIITTTVSKLINDFIVHISVDDAVNNIKLHLEKYGNLEHLASLKVLEYNLSAIQVFFVYIKIFKYINFSKTMGQLNNTLRKCAAEVLGFSVMFFIVFFAFAELGYLLFGNQLEEFSTFGMSMFTLLRTILGDFDYERIEQANRFLAPIFFISYIFFVFFVLLNMFLVIINDSYAEVKTEIAIAPDEMQMTDFLKNILYRNLKKCGWKMKSSEKGVNPYNVTISQIREALKKCEFSDLEIEMFFARYNINPMVDIKEVDIAKLMEELDHDTGGHLAMETAIRVDDVKRQSERLTEVEKTIQRLMGTVNELLNMLETASNVQKTTV